MTDIMTKKQRSYTMPRIRDKWTKIEKEFHNYLKGQKIRHKMHPTMEGKPDIILPNNKTAVFLDGCFWHACPKCKGDIRPRTNRSYWIPKIENTINRKYHK